MVSEWFREVPDDPGSVRNGPGSVRNGFGHIWKVSEGPEGSGILWKVPEGSGTTRAVQGSPEGSIIGATTFSLRGKESLTKSIRIDQRRQFWTRFRVTETYRNSFKLGASLEDEPRALATYKRGPRAP